MMVLGVVVHRMLTSNNNYEVIAVLTSVFGGVSCNLDTPSRAFDVGKGSRVGTIGCIGVDSGISLVVDIEGFTLRVLVTVRSASDNIVAAQGLVSEPRGGLARGLKIRERQ